jgi:hypothetical protein
LCEKLVEKLMCMMVSQSYRYWVVWRCPHVRFLDFAKVKESERERARELFGTAEEPTALATQVRRQLIDAMRRRFPTADS